MCKSAPGATSQFRSEGWPLLRAAPGPLERTGVLCLANFGVGLRVQGAWVRSGGWRVLGRENAGLGARFTGTR